MVFQYNSYIVVDCTETDKRAWATSTNPPAGTTARHVPTCVCKCEHNRYKWSGFGVKIVELCLCGTIMNGCTGLMGSCEYICPDSSTRNNAGDHG